MGEFSLSHILLFGGIMLLLFGPSRLPGLGKSMGEAIRGFKKGMDGDVTPDERPEQITSSQSAEKSTQANNQTNKEKDKV
jgi:sec-independent protein translocase protein TatA